MEHVLGIDNFKLNNKTAVTIGKFDGIHRGHRILIDSVLKRKKGGFLATVITFSTSPKEFFNKGSEVKYILTRTERNEMLSSLGIDIQLEVIFDKNMAETAPEDFIKLLFNKINMRYIAVGRDFRFGNKGCGDISLIEELSREMGFEFNACNKLKSGGNVISSTDIINAIVMGDMEIAEEMLGYNYFIQNRIISGNHIGRKIGYPTINIYPPKDKVIPRFGVYATRVYVDGICYEAMTNIGLRPTIDEEIKTITIESHVFSGDFSSKTENIRVEFIKFIRPEQKFASVSELTSQIQKDEGEIRRFFKL